ncbi:hypothetical protein OSB04_005983 [Centaurea solstitialis]|uniref:Protein LIKE COV 3 n=1 Tax=Centaurea solstitialis TaxID=347529 RepID=A0AA38TPM9_9ASTR|nr:hypothetical protein OSB04_005983 [Centaurea solstitialis]
MAEGSKESTSSTVSQHDIIVEDTEDTVKSPPNSPNSSTRKKKSNLSIYFKSKFKRSKHSQKSLTPQKRLTPHSLEAAPQRLRLKPCPGPGGVSLISGFGPPRGACYAVLQSWVSKKFMTGCVVLFPVAVTFFITWWIVQFFDGFFSPIYERLGVEIFGESSRIPYVIDLHILCWHLCFIMDGCYCLLGREWFIKRMPFVKHIYSASKQISAAISPDQNTTAFKEVAIIRHPRLGEYAFGFITSSVVLQAALIWESADAVSTYPRENGDEELCSVYVPTNHLYIGDVFLVNSEEIIRPNLSIREGIGIDYCFGGYVDATVDISYREGLKSKRKGSTQQNNVEAEASLNPLHIICSFFCNEKAEK